MSGLSGRHVQLGLSLRSGARLPGGQFRAGARHGGAAVPPGRPGRALGLRQRDRGQALRHGPIHPRPPSGRGRFLSEHLRRAAAQDEYFQGPGQGRHRHRPRLHPGQGRLRSLDPDYYKRHDVCFTYGCNLPGGAPACPWAASTGSASAAGHPRQMARGPGGRATAGPPSAPGKPRTATWKWRAASVLAQRTSSTKPSSICPRPCRDVPLAWP